VKKTIIVKQETRKNDKRCLECGAYITTKTHYGNFCCSSCRALYKEKLKLEEQVSSMKKQNKRITNSISTQQSRVEEFNRKYGRQN
jgi:hypothetical protein